jgi:hypothetical protein
VYKNIHNVKREASLFASYLTHHIAKHDRRVKVKVKVSSPCTGPEGSRRLRLTDFKTIDT